METNGCKEVAEVARERVHEVQERVADGLEELRAYAGSADKIIREFARDRPLLAIGCAVGLGFLIGRLASRA